MIDHVLEQLSQFVLRWNSAVSNHPELALDGTWPSAGIVDCMLFRLRKKRELSESDRKLLRFAALYLAKMARDCWSEARVSALLEIGEHGVSITAADDSQNALFSMNIESVLSQLLAECSAALPVISTYVRNFAAQRNIVSVFGIGLMTGLSPFGNGKWAKTDPALLAENTAATVRYLGRTCAQHYERLYPDEIFGQVGELYLHQLIYPPAGFDEPFPAQLAVRGLAAALREIGTTPETQHALYRNFARSADDLLSSAGIAALGAVATALPSREVKALTESNGTYTGLLRFAMADYKNALGNNRNWLFTAELRQDDLVQYVIEREMGFMPWFYFSPEVLVQRERLPRLNRLFEHLAFFDLASARECCSEIALEEPGNFDVRLQQIFLSLVFGDIERAEFELKLLLTEPGCENEPRLFTLAGLVTLSRGQRDDAVGYLERAHGLLLPGSLERGRVANDLGWALLVSQQFERSLPFFAEASEKPAAPIASLLNRAFSLGALGREDERRSIVEEALQLAPTDRKVFTVACTHLVDEALSAA